MLRFSITFKDLLFAYISVVCLFLFSFSLAYAHSPHDVIDSLALSPYYDQDKTLYITITHKLLRSTDSGFGWKELVNGLDNSGNLTSIAVSPSFDNDKTLFLASDSDGIYRSQDNGNSWSKVNKGLNVLSFSLLSISSAYSSDQTVLAAGSEGGLYKTQNKGENWSQVLSNDIHITAIAFYSKNNEQILLGDNSGNLYLSVDGGNHWQQHSKFQESGAITSIAISLSTTSGNTFFVGTEKQGIFKTIDNGTTFVATNNGLSDISITSVALSPNYQTDRTIFASAWNAAVFRSNDGGNSWVKYSQGVSSDPQANLKKYWSPHYKDLKISHTFAKDRTVFLGGYGGLFKSTDSGNTWQQKETLPLKIIAGMSLSNGDKQNPSLAISTYGGGAYLTADLGKTWTICNQGLKTTRLSDIKFSPNYDLDNTLFSASRGYLLKSTDNGVQWHAVSVDPENWLIYKLKRWMGKPKKKEPFPHVIALSPNFTADKTIYFGSRYQGIFKSANGGQKISQIWNAMMGRVVASLVLSPAITFDNTLFASIRGAGVYKTVDNGNTWLAANNGLTFVSTWRELPIASLGDDHDVHLVISHDYNTDKTVFTASSKGLFKTTNGGKNWQQVSKKIVNIIAIAISPNYVIDKTLIVSVKGRGLFKSIDGGISFVEIAPDLIKNNHAIHFIKFSSSYKNDHSIYIASKEEIFQSSDAGKSWNTMSLNKPVRYEDHREVIQYEGSWQILKGQQMSASRVTHSDTAQDKATLGFVGTGINWIGTTSKNQGIAKVYIDGDHVTDIDQFSKSKNFMVPTIFCYRFAT